MFLSSPHWRNDSALLLCACNYVRIGLLIFRIIPEMTTLNCSLPLTVLNFINNFTEPDLEVKWPCEVRYYWLSLQPFVRSVRFLLRYVTPFIIVLGKKSSFYAVLILDRSHIML